MSIEKGMFFYTNPWVENMPNGRKKDLS